jgi:A/G-specific adenine glycosylase
VLHSSPAFARHLLRWYDRHRRDLPWRVSPGRPGPLDPYHVLVSETMLQQTQVATVIPYYHRFLARFPTIADLARADEQEVLRLWQGLGYYSRARNLQAAARMVVSDYGGQMPGERDELLKLPGVGQYTAGAVASIAFDRRAPILDGNVTRVLCRLDYIRADPRARETVQLLWRRAEEILPSRRIGDFNSALMELGATVCTPRNPQCLICPVREHCEAQAAGAQEQVPAPKKAKPTPLIRRRTYCIRHHDRWLIEQRPARGRWAGMWQFLTVDASPGQGNADPVPLKQCRRLGMVSHALTHRRYEFDVYVARVGKHGTGNDPHRRWVTLAELEAYPLPRPHLKMVQMLRDDGTVGSPGRRAEVAKGHAH